MTKVAHFVSINESHEAMGFRLRTDIPEFHVFTMEETYPDTRCCMPPYTRDFYQVSLIHNSQDAIVTIDTSSQKDNPSMLFTVAPEQILSWVRGRAQTGYIVYFKSTFLSHLHRPVPATFPFFGLGEIGMAPVQDSQANSIQAQLQRMHEVFHSTHLFRIDLLKVLLHAVLLECAAVYRLQDFQIQKQTPSVALVLRFQHAVGQHFHGRRSVKGYAQLLNVSVDHLTETVKRHTGTTPNQVIAARILLEAKRLLAYTDLNIAEIADHLSFSEPTHFTRFFKRHSTQTPGQFRHSRALS